MVLGWNKGQSSACGAGREDGRHGESRKVELHYQYAVLPGLEFFRCVLFCSLPTIMVGGTEEECGARLFGSEKLRQCRTKDSQQAKRGATRVSRVESVESPTACMCTTCRGIGVKKVVVKVEKDEL